MNFGHGDRAPRDSRGYRCAKGMLTIQQDARTNMVDASIRQSSQRIIQFALRRGVANTLASIEAQTDLDTAINII